MKIEIKHEDIIMWKGFNWSKLLTLDKYNFSRMLTQVVTLSRCTHTAIYYTYLEKEYLVQAGFGSGMHILDITGEQWFRENIKTNTWDLYRFRDKQPLSNSFQRIILAAVTDCYNNKLKSVKIGYYNYIGFANQFFYNVFGKSPLQQQTRIESMFCSEFNYYYFTKSENSFLISPAALADSDLFKKVY